MNVDDIINGSLLANASIQFDKDGELYLKQYFPEKNQSYVEWKVKAAVSGRATWWERTTEKVVFCTKNVTQGQYEDWNVNCPTYVFDRFNPQIFSILYMDKGGLYSDGETSFIRTYHLKDYDVENLCESIKYIFGYRPRHLGDAIGMNKHLTNEFAHICAPFWPLAMAYKFPRKELIPDWAQFQTYPGF